MITVDSLRRALPMLAEEERNSTGAQRVYWHGQYRAVVNLIGRLLQSQIVASRRTGQTVTVGIDYVDGDMVLVLECKGARGMVYGHSQTARAGTV